MKKIAIFEKVSKDIFAKAWTENFRSELTYAEGLYNKIQKPCRATKGSAGYDFFAPDKIMIAAGESVIVPTGIRVKIDNGWVLKIYPRSGLGFKYKLQLNNTVGIIDSDYYHSDNEGHIFIKLTNDGREGKSVIIEQGSGFAQGIFVEYGITYDDNAKNLRNGGFGSTNKIKI